MNVFVAYVVAFAVASEIRERTKKHVDPVVVEENEQSATKLFSIDEEGDIATTTGTVYSSATNAVFFEPRKRYRDAPLTIGTNTAYFGTTIMVTNCVAYVTP